MKKRKRKWKPSSIILPLLLISLLWYLGSSTIEMSKVRRDKIITIRRNNEKIAQMEKDIQELEQEIEKSDTMDYVEKVARDEWGMIKPREIIFVDKNKKSEKPYDKKVFE
ncbi:MAG: septum formation initiator family protein [Tissierellia bacterium]|nr:septum formation initiator family protein [Tissierellia bacterium]